MQANGTTTNGTKNGTGVKQTNNSILDKYLPSVIVALVMSGLMWVVNSSEKANINHEVGVVKSTHTTEMLEQCQEDLEELSKGLMDVNERLAKVESTRFQQVDADKMKAEIMEYLSLQLNLINTHTEYIRKDVASIKEELERK